LVRCTLTPRQSHDGRRALSPAGSLVRRTAAHRRNVAQAGESAVTLANVEAQCRRAVLHNPLGARMFRSAVAAAMKFTHPVLVPRRQKNGICSSSLGTFVVVNADGWIITAGHVLEEISKIATEEIAAREHERLEAAIRNDASLSQKDRMRALRNLGHLAPDSTDRCSALWGGLNSSKQMSLQDISIVAGVDVGIGRLDPFDAKAVSAFPEFKDPKKDFEVGASLCRLGFPFHNITPQWDTTTNGFVLPTQAFPIPFYPNDAILTRFHEVKVVDRAGNPVASPFPTLRIETSTPGLKGQSGGPIFDVKGAVWGIQCVTQHLPLGFNCVIKDPLTGRSQEEHQFLNLGIGVHAATIIGLFDQVGVKYVLSKH
jgi:hypothetical protein